MVTQNREDPWYWASLLVADLDIVGVGDWRGCEPQWCQHCSSSGGC